MSPVSRLPSCVPRPYPASRVPDSSSLPLPLLPLSRLPSPPTQARSRGRVRSLHCRVQRSSCPFEVGRSVYGIRPLPSPLVRGGSPSRRATREVHTQAFGVYMSMSVSTLMSAPQTSTRTCGQWPVASTADAGAGDARPGCVSDSMLLLRASERARECVSVDGRALGRRVRVCVFRLFVS